MKYLIALILIAGFGVSDAQACNRNRRVGELLLAPAVITYRVATVVPRAVVNRVTVRERSVVRTYSSGCTSSVIVPVVPVTPAPVPTPSPKKK